MSVPFFRIFTGVFLAHVLVLSLVWVGFSAPLPRPPTVFIYEGSLPDEGTVSSSKEGPKNEAYDQFISDQLKSANFNNWATLREESKSSYAHLGF